MTSNLFVFQGVIAIKAHTCAFKQSYYYTCICLFEMLFILDLYVFYNIVEKCMYSILDRMFGRMGYGLFLNLFLFSCFHFV